MRKPFTTLAVVIFAIVAVVHALRLILGWEVTVDGVTIPLWASVVGAILAMILAVMLKKES